MKLAQIVSSGRPVPLDRLGTDRPLCREVQSALESLGCLDPPVDGEFGTISTLALRSFAKALRIADDGEALSVDLARALLEQTPDTFLPLRPGKDLAGRVVKYMLQEQQFVARLPGFLTIAYVEGAGTGGKPNADTFDKWNDVRLVLRRRPDGRPEIVHRAVATTEPGRHYTLTPLNPKGAARIAFGQQKAWGVGTHQLGEGAPREHEALVQVRPVTVHRDKNKDGIRPGDRTERQGLIGLNQHSGLDQPAGSIGRASAGCLVARRDADHKAFMRLARTDPRFKASRGYVFMTTVIPGDDLAKHFPVA